MVTTSVSVSVSLSIIVTNFIATVLAQTQYFYSVPNLAPPSLVVETNNVALANPGCIFVTPFQDNQPSPLIYSSNGMLIWDGTDLVTPLNAYGLTVCNYNRSAHLCFVDAEQYNGYGRGKGIILDNTYKQVATVQSGNGMPNLDQHEFKLVDDGATAIITIYNSVQYDPSSNGIHNVSWVLNGAFQEIDIATGAVLFEWNSLDHVPVTLSQVMPGTTDISGNGLTTDTAWDYFHINSVDKDGAGNFLISSRHTKTIFKLNGTNGSILWQLGGLESDFTMDYEFNFQHFARVRLMNGSSITQISLYDNGSDDNAPPPGQTKPGYEPYSSGIVAFIDEVGMTSTLAARYISPGYQTSHSQGDLFFLENGNRFLGMGDVPYVVEFTNNGSSDGEVVYYAHLALDNGTYLGSYRNFKFNWSAMPNTSPALFTYAQSCTGEMVFYASWNGATEVVSWRFSVSRYVSGAFTAAGTVSKTGFETMAMFSLVKYAPYAIAEAVDSSGKILARSASVATFVPNTFLIPNCTSVSCGIHLNYTSAPQTNCSRHTL